MRKSLRSVAVVVVCLATLLGTSGCFTLQHTIGSGAQTGVEDQERQWYALWGLIPLGSGVDGGQMAGGATNFEIESEMSGVDFLLNLVTAWVTIVSRTVTVTK